jgi:SAM-dependent methyltransferase
MPATEADRRARPRVWHHDYLHLRPLARDLKRAIDGARRERSFRAVLDLGSGGSPYGTWFAEAAGYYVRLDADAAHRPTATGLAEALPFRDATFDAVLFTQVWGLLSDPGRAACEIERIARPGARLWLSGPAGWPYDSARPEHRFGAPDLAVLFSGLEVLEVVPQWGMLVVPFAVFNLVVREAVIAAERRAGAAARVLRWPAAAAYVLSNLAGGTLALLSERGPAAPFLGYLDRRMPTNFLVVARKR